MARPNFHVQVSAVRQLTERVREYLLTSPDGTPLPAYSAGSHIALHTVSPTRGLIVRHYSLVGGRDLQDDARHTYRIAVQREPFDMARETAAVREGRADVGAVVTFTGICRDEGGTLTALELEHYPFMAEAELTRIAEEAARRWPIGAATIIHRTGTIAPGEDIVLVVTASPHRAAALEAVIRRHAHTQFWTYTRSFGDPVDVLPELTGISNLAVYLSVDADSPLRSATDEQLTQLLTMGRGYHTLNEIDRKSRFFFTPEESLEYDAKSVEKILKKDDGQGLKTLRAIREVIAGLDAWTPTAL